MLPRLPPIYHTHRFKRLNMLSRNGGTRQNLLAGKLHSSLCFPLCSSEVIFAVPLLIPALTRPARCDVPETVTVFVIAFIIYKNIPYTGDLSRVSVTFIYSPYIYMPDIRCTPENTHTFHSSEAKIFRIWDTFLNTSVLFPILCPNAHK